MNSSAVLNPPLPVSGVDHGLQLVHQTWQHIFECQDLENDHFDVTFDVEGKLLHAHRFMLTSQSETFKVMFSSRWSTPTAPIQIANHTFDDFKTFLGYLYFAPIQPTNNNLMVIVDLAEYYDIQRIKDQCDEWLSTQEEFTPLSGLYEAAKTYSLMKSKTAILSYILLNCLKTAEMVLGYNFSKEIFMDLVTSQRLYSTEEDLFKTVYNWAINKHRDLGKSSKAFREALKTELADILPHIKFGKMRVQFLKRFLSPKKYIFDDDSWNEIKLMFENPQVIFKFNNSDKTMLESRRSLLADEKIVDFIKSLENKRPSVLQRIERPSVLHRNVFGHIRFVCCWLKKCKIPSKPSQLTINENVPYYLCISDDDHDRIAVKERSDIKNRDYLLAELHGAKHQFTKDCRISVK